jgi:hypothetical protein
MKGNVTNTGYWPNSPDRNNDYNIIPSNEITMEGMNMPLIGISNTGDMRVMNPNENHKFNGDYVTEFPMNNNAIFLGKFKYANGGLVKLDEGGPGPKLSAKQNKYLLLPDNDYGRMRQQAYADSLSAYNAYPPPQGMNTYNATREEFLRDNNPAPGQLIRYHNIKNRNFANNARVTPGNISPIGDAALGTDGWEWVYKKPVQPIKLEPKISKLPLKGIEDLPASDYQIDPLRLLKPVKYLDPNAGYLTTDFGDTNSNVEERVQGRFNLEDNTWSQSIVDKDGNVVKIIHSDGTTTYPDREEAETPTPEAETPTPKKVKKRKLQRLPAFKPGGETDPPKKSNPKDELAKFSKKPIDPNDLRYVGSQQAVQDNARVVVPNIQLADKKAPAAQNEIQRVNKEIKARGVNSAAEVYAQEEAEAKKAAAEAAAIEAGTNDTLYADTQTDSDKLLHQMYNIASNPLDALGHYNKYGYVQQGNIGNYGLKDQASPMGAVLNLANPVAWFNAGARLKKDLGKEETYTTKEGALTALADLAEAAPMLKPLRVLAGAAGPTVNAAVKPYSTALINVLNKPLIKSSLPYGQPALTDALTTANFMKGMSIYDAGTRYIPNAITDINKYNETGDFEYIKDAAYNAGKGALEFTTLAGPLVKEANLIKKPVSLFDDASKAVDENKDDAAQAYSFLKTLKNVAGYVKEYGGDISVPDLRRVKIKSLPRTWKSQ